MTLFGDNDPLHFGSIMASLFTFFQISTFDTWAPIMYVNLYGCDQFPSDYIIYNASDGNAGTDGMQLTYLRFGTMHMPVCHSPQAHPILAPILFMSFVVIAGFILVSLTVAVVTSGIHDRLEELKESEEVDINKELKRMQMIQNESNKGARIHSLSTDDGNMPHDPPTPITSGMDSPSMKKAEQHEESLLENKDMLLMIMEQVMLLLLFFDKVQLM